MKICVVFLLGFISPAFALAYEVDTHAYLTQETIDLYNRVSAGKQIEAGLWDYLIDGSRREDDQFREVNHFYDPVNDRGLTIGRMSYPKSSEWAIGENLQNEHKYRASSLLGSMLNPDQEKRLAVLPTESNFTWERGVRAYARGDRELSMFVLGHILHLIQDLSVPEHVRNDPHLRRSPYEDWVSRFNLKNPDASLKISASINSQYDLLKIFSDISVYTNSNFYSWDSIGINSGYAMPQPTEFERNGGMLVAINSYGGQRIKLYKQPLVSSLMFNTRKAILFDSAEIMSDYWSHLAPKAIQYGANAIRIFIEEGEKAKRDPDFVKEDPKSKLAEMFEATRDGFAHLRAFFSGKSIDVPDVSEINYPKEPVDQSFKTAESAEPGLSVKLPRESSTTADTSGEPKPAPGARSAEQNSIEVDPSRYSLVIDDMNAQINAGSEVPQLVFGGGSPPEMAVLPIAEAATVETASSSTSTLPVEDPVIATSSPISILSFSGQASGTEISFSWQHNRIVATSSIFFSVTTSAPFIQTTSTNFVLNEAVEGDNLYWLSIEDGGAISVTSTRVFIEKVDIPIVEPGTIQDFQWEATSTERSMVFSGLLGSPTPGEKVAIEVDFLPAEAPFGNPKYQSQFIPDGSMALLLVPNVIDGPYHWRVRVVSANGAQSGWQYFNEADVVIPVRPALLSGRFSQSDPADGFCNVRKEPIIPDINIQVLSVDFWAGCINGTCDGKNSFRIYAEDKSTLVAETDGDYRFFGGNEPIHINQVFSGDNITTLVAGRTYYLTPYSEKGSCQVHPLDPVKSVFMLQ